MKKLITILVVIFLLFGCSSKNEQKITLTISAAASMKDVLASIQKRYEATHPSARLSFNFGSSGALKQQIEQGAPVDVFISASTEPFQQLKEKGFIVNQKDDDLVYNELALIVNKATKITIQSPNDLTDRRIKTVALGIPETVPAGAYAKRWLQSLGIWDKIQTKLVFAKDVREVLAYVETGNAEAGMVYRTDALFSKKVQIVTEAGRALDKRIIYKAGIVKSSSHRKEANEFLNYLHSKEAQNIFQKYGFIRIEK